MATADLSWLEFSPGVDAQVSWLEFSAPPASITADVSWLEFSAPSVGATAAVSWLEFRGSPTVYTLMADAGAYTMTWAGSVSQVVLVAETGEYVMTDQSVSLDVIVDAVQPTINTGDNLRYLVYRNRRPVLFPE